MIKAESIWCAIRSVQVRTSLEQLFLLMLCFVHHHADVEIKIDIIETI